MLNRKAELKRSLKGLYLEEVDEIKAHGFVQVSKLFNPVNYFAMRLLKVTKGGVVIYRTPFVKLMPAREHVDLWVFSWLIIYDDGGTEYIWRYSPTSSALDAYLWFPDNITGNLETLRNSVKRSITADKRLLRVAASVRKHYWTRWRRLLHYFGFRA